MQMQVLDIITGNIKATKEVVNGIECLKLTSNKQIMTVQSGELLFCVSNYVNGRTRDTALGNFYSFSSLVDANRIDIILPNSTILSISVKGQQAIMKVRMY